MSERMKRREFIALLGGAAAAWPMAARAQQPAMPVIGFLGGPSRATYAQNIAAIYRGLEENGYVEGRNIVTEERWANGQYDLLPALAAELVRLRVAVILTLGGPPPALAAKAATSTIPIVFHMGADPVELGLVNSLNRPGSNITGATILSTALGAKRLGLLCEMVPAAKLIGILVNPDNPQSVAHMRDVEGAASVIGRALLVLNVRTEREVEAAFPVLAEKHADALIIGGDPFVTNMIAGNAALAMRYRMPTIAGTRDFVLAGGLMSYATDVAQVYRQAGIYAGRILKGDKPADLPVTQPTKFELVINIKTAKALRLAVPATLLSIADEVIE